MWQYLLTLSLISLPRRHSTLSPVWLIRLLAATACHLLLDHLIDGRKPTSGWYVTWSSIYYDSRVSQIGRQGLFVLLQHVEAWGGMGRHGLLLDSINMRKQTQSQHWKKPVDTIQRAKVSNKRIMLDMPAVDTVEECTYTLICSLTHHSLSTQTSVIQFSSFSLPGNVHIS